MSGFTLVLGIQTRVLLLVQQAVCMDPPPQPSLSSSTLSFQFSHGSSFPALFETLRLPIIYTLTLTSRGLQAYQLYLVPLFLVHLLDLTFDT